MALERRCTDGVERLKSILDTQMHGGISHTDLWDKTVSFFTPKKTLIFHDGYSKYSRETLRLFPAPDEDVIHLCFQQWWTSRLENKTNNNHNKKNYYTDWMLQLWKMNPILLYVVLLQNGKKNLTWLHVKSFVKTSEFCYAQGSVGLLFCPQLDYSHCYLVTKSFTILCTENG